VSFVFVVMAWDRNRSPDQLTQARHHCRGRHTLHENGVNIVLAKFRPGNRKSRHDSNIGWVRKSAHCAYHAPTSGGSFHAHVCDHQIVTLGGKALAGLLGSSAASHLSPFQTQDGAEAFSYGEIVLCEQNTRFHDHNPLRQRLCARLIPRRKIRRSLRSGPVHLRSRPAMRY